MNHKDFVKSIASRTGLPINQTADTVAALLDVIAVDLRTTGEVSLKGVGKLVRVRQAARTGRNPKTGELVLIPERESVKFKRSESLVL